MAQPATAAAAGQVHFTRLSNPTRARTPTFSGFATKKGLVALVAIPWVTAVGATRFGQEVGNDEMASDQFGSGGGFQQFDQTNAQQAAETAKYLANALASRREAYPPRAAAPRTCRARRGLPGDCRRPPDLGWRHLRFLAGIRRHDVDAQRYTSASGQAGHGLPERFLYKNADAFTDITAAATRSAAGATIAIRLELH